VARLHPCVPLLNGFMGDRVMRSTVTAAGTAFFMKDEQELSLADLFRTADDRYTLHTNRLDLLRPSIVQNTIARAESQMKRIVGVGHSLGRPMCYIDLFYRHRYYFAQIVNQHLDAAAALTPFYRWELINLRTSKSVGSYLWDNYRMLFEQHFPQLLGIGHSHFIKEKLRRQTHEPATRHLRRWTIDLLAALMSRRFLHAAKKKSLLARLPRGLAQDGNCQNEIMFLRKVLLFETELANAGVLFDWDQI
jgi:hypothetical protein